MTLPRLSHLYADNFWLELGNRLNKITYLDDVLIEHMHPAAGKATQDAGYEFSSNYNLHMQDKKIFEKYLLAELDTDTKKLRAMMRRTRNL